MKGHLAIKSISGGPAPRMVKLGHEAREGVEEGPWVFTERSINRRE